MQVRRWKGQSLILHRHVTSPESEASRQGLLPLYVHLAFIIASTAGAVAGLAKKAWRDGEFGAMSIEALRALRKQINDAFDRMEEAIPLEPDGDLPTAIPPQNLPQAQTTYNVRGNFGMLAIGLMEEAAELAVPLMKLADGSATLDEVRREIEDESSDLRVYHHITNVQASVSEAAASNKWAQVRERFPAVFDPQPANDKAEKGAAHA